MGIYVKGNPKEGDYKLIKTTDGFVLEGEDIAYACVEVDDELMPPCDIRDCSWYSSDEWYNWRDEQEYEDRWEKRIDEL